MRAHTIAFELAPPQPLRDLERRRTPQARPTRPDPVQSRAARGAPHSDAAQLEVHWASCGDDVRDAQRLRHQVFAQELGACLSPPGGTPPGLDVDRFDAHCDHLLVRAPRDASGQPGAVVGTYRLLSPAAARRAGGLYIDTEFDLAPLAGLRPHLVELGRSCVHPAWRSGGVILALWSALAQYMHSHGLNTMVGCASIGLGDGGAAARALWQHLQPSHLAEPRWRVDPYEPLPLLASPCAIARLEIPPLIKGYLRCGARLLGPPALDTAFNTADLPMIMRIGELAPRYRKHFLGR